MSSNKHVMSNLFMILKHLTQILNEIPWQDCQNGYLKMVSLKSVLEWNVLILNWLIEMIN